MGRHAALSRSHWLRLGRETTRRSALVRKRKAVEFIWDRRIRSRAEFLHDLLVRLVLILEVAQN